MKKITLFFIILTGLFMNVQAQDWNWGLVQMGPDIMYGIFPQSIDTVYVVGANGMIAQSVDMGNTWSRMTSPVSTDLEDVLFLTHETGFIVGANGVILKTVNAGVNWNIIDSGTSSRLKAIAATNLNNIWIVGENSTVLQSVDGGNSWQVKNIVSGIVTLNDIAFRGNVGYFVGIAGTAYKTEDSGISWVVQPVTPTVYYLHNLSITENNVFVVAGSDHYSPIYVNFDYNSKFDLQSSGVFFLNNNTGYVVRFAGLTCWGCYDIMCFLFKTTDCGSSWKQVRDEINVGSYTTLPGNYTKITFFNDTIGYIMNGLVLLKVPYPKNPWDPPHTKINENEAKHSVKIIDLKNSFEIESSQYSILWVDIFTVSGEKVLSKNFNNAMHVKINSDFLNSGMYLVKIGFTNNETTTVKWIKK